MATIDQINRAKLKRKAHMIRDQKHFDLIMEIFPEEMRAEVWAEVRPLLRAPLVWTKPPKPE